MAAKECVRDPLERSAGEVGVHKREEDREGGHIRRRRCSDGKREAAVAQGDQGCASPDDDNEQRPVHDPRNRPRRSVGEDDRHVEVDSHDQDSGDEDGDALLSSSGIRRGCSGGRPYAWVMALVITIPDDAARRLAEAATGRGVTPEELARDLLTSVPDSSATA